MGSLLRSALNTSERASEPPQERWLEAAVDGLLTVEGERFMLSLPLNIEPNLTAILRPQIINELAELRRVRNRVLKRIDELLRAEWRSGHHTWHPICKTWHHRTRHCGTAHWLACHPRLA